VAYGGVGGQFRVFPAIADNSRKRSIRMRCGKKEQKGHSIKKEEKVVMLKNSATQRKSNATVQEGQENEAVFVFGKENS